MKKVKRFIPFIIIVIIVGTICFIVGKRIGLNTDTSVTTKTIENVNVEKRNIQKTLTASGQIESASSEKLYLSTTNYYSSACVEEGDLVKAGENLIGYTNGTYLTAPYDLLVTSVSIPDVNTKATSSNYVEVKNMNNLIISLNISESEISNIKLEDEVEITLSADSTKTYSGKISKITSIANYSSSGSTFPVEVSIENDGSIKIGMSASCSINISKVEDVIAIPISAVQIKNTERYVYVVENDNVVETAVTTGISDDEYVEITSGLEVGQTIQVITETKQNTIRSTTENNDRKSNMPGGNGGGGMPSGSGSGGGPNMNGGERNSESRGRPQNQGS